MSFLVIDIGNTSTSLGLFQSGRVSPVKRIEKVVQNRESISSIIRATIGRRSITGVGLASVVPPLNRLWGDVVSSLFHLEPLWIHHRLNLGVAITYPQPETIGADRLANAAGGVAKYGAPLIVADFGTAVTFDLITKQAGYIGGVIAPGLPLMFDYLAERTAQLPHLSWQPVRHRVGKSTAEAMQLGAHWGYRGMVREILAEVLRYPALRGAKLCATGGFAGRVLRGISPKPILDPTLTLYGIGRICLGNR
jgi:type III pantothenate kinase